MLFKTLPYKNLNQIYYYTGAFSGLDQVTFLDLGGNRLKNISEAMLSPLTKLVTLKLPLNNITRIHRSSMSNMNHSLSELQLYGNQLTSLPPNLLDGFSNLSMLYLHNNMLSSLDWRVFGEKHPQKLKLTFWNNPRICKSLTVCWMMEATHDGWLVLQDDMSIGHHYRKKTYPYDCLEYPDMTWYDVSRFCANNGMYLLSCVFKCTLSIPAVSLGKAKRDRLPVMKINHKLL